MKEAGIKSIEKTGTVVDFTGDPTYEMIPGKIYSGTFSVSGLISGDEDRVINDITNQIVYPTGHPEYYERCTPTYILADSARGVAYVEWTVNDTESMLAPDGNPTVVPLVAYVFLICITAIIVAWLLTVALSKATEFVSESGDNFKWIAIALALTAGAAVIIASVYAYGKVVGDQPISKYIEERKKKKSSDS